MFEDIFQSLMPHGHCFLDRKQWVPIYAVSNLLISASYISIFVALLKISNLKRIIAYKWPGIIYGLFILLCGIGHLLMVWNIYNGQYVIETIWHSLTAIISFIAAFMTFNLYPVIKKFSQQEAIEPYLDRIKYLQKKIEEMDTR